jgi:hypothetical protein
MNGKLIVCGGGGCYWTARADQDWQHLGDISPIATNPGDVQEQIL